jgi:hypothetical protein
MEQPIVVIKTFDIPPKGKKQAQFTVPSRDIEDMVAAGASKIVFRRCGLHLSIDPVFDPPKD